MQPKSHKQKGRQSLSCLNCKNRKVKCDRNKPICSACLRNRIPSHLCVYQDAITSFEVAKQIVTTDVHVSVIDKLEDSPSMSSNEIDVRDFVYTKINGDYRILFGTTSYKTVLKEAVNEFPVILEIFSKSYEDISKVFSKVIINRPINIISIESALKKLPDLLPSYKDCLTILSVFIQSSGLFYRCFNGNTILEYFNAVIQRNPSSKRVMIKKSFSQVRLSVIVSIIAITSFSYGDVKLNQLELLSISKSLLYDTDIKSTIPTFLGLLLLYEARKYDFNIDFEESLSHDQALLSNIVVMGNSLGLGRDIIRMHGNGEPDFVRSLKNSWIYIYFEDTVRSFQKGQQPLLRENYLSRYFESDEMFDYEGKLRVLRVINEKMNSYEFSKSVNVDLLINDLTGILSQSDFEGLNNEEKHFQLIILTYIQALSHVRYLKTKSVETRNKSFKDSLKLYVTALSFMKSTVINNDSANPISPSPYYHEIKEALFRSAFYFLPAILAQVNPDMKSVQTKQQQVYQALTFQSVEEIVEGSDEVVSSHYYDIFWLLNLITNDYQMVLSKLSLTSFSSRTMFIFTNNILSYVMGVLETANNANNLSPVINQQAVDFDSLFNMPILDLTSIINKDDILDFFL